MRREHRTAPVEITRCNGCGYPSRTLYCDFCAPPPPGADSPLRSRLSPMSRDILAAREAAHRIARKSIPAEGD